MSEGDARLFHVPVTAELERAGLRGLQASISLEGDTLRLSGEEGGEIAVQATDVERLQLAHFGGSRLPTLYEAKIWRKSLPGPLLIVAGRQPGQYGPAMKAFAGRIAGRGGAVMRGPSLRTALAGLLLAGGSLTLLAAGAVLLAVLDDGWGWWLLAIALIVIDGLWLVATFRNRWPRRVLDPDELDRELPPAKEE